MTTGNSDKLTPELRAVEKEVDSYYMQNPLVNLPFASAAWHLLAFGEDSVIVPIINAEQQSVHDHKMMADNLVNELNYPMRWLYCSCLPGGEVLFSYDSDVYTAASNLMELAYEYRSFVTAFSYASRGWIGMTLRDTVIQPTDDTYTGMEYEAYDWLIRPYESPVDISQFPGDEILHTLRIQNDRFTYRLNPRIVSDTIQALKPEFDRRFSLPEDWQFSRYTLGDFRRVFGAINAIAYIHFNARMMAASQGCIGLGYADCIYVPTHGELLRRVIRYSGISEVKVMAIFDDLSYGNRGISNPDPALQPLIRLNSDVYAIMPSLWRFSAAERNLTVLLNRLPSERDIYSRLVSEKEKLMRERIESRLAGMSFRHVHDTVPDLPDIDLALVDDTEKACLLIELKWFIEPAEVREIVEKTEEIKKGISQLIQLMKAFTNGNKWLLERLDVDSSYEVLGVVVSANSIGHSSVQSPRMPVIWEDHLIAKLEATPSLRAVMEWLNKRRYLPAEGEHFEVGRITATVGRWGLEWYGVKPLISEAFMPL